jgi:hypothetical protein
MAKRKEIMLIILVQLVALLMLSSCVGCNSCNCQPDESPISDDPIQLTADGYLALIQDPANQSAEVSILLASGFWLEEIQAHGYNRPLVYDVTSERGAELMQEIESQALPQLVFLNGNGSVLASVPAANSDLINQIKRLLNGGI